MKSFSEVSTELHEATLKCPEGHVELKRESVKYGEETINIIYTECKEGITVFLNGVAGLTYDWQLILTDPGASASDFVIASSAGVNAGVVPNAFDQRPGEGWGMGWQFERISSVDASTFYSSKSSEHPEVVLLVNSNGNDFANVGCTCRFMSPMVP